MKYILFILFFIPLLSFSKDFNESYFTLKFGGWSYHGDNITSELYKESTGKELKYNESHNGIGFDYLKPLSENNKHYMEQIL